MCLLFWLTTVLAQFSFSSGWSLMTQQNKESALGCWYCLHSMLLSCDTTLWWKPPLLSFSLSLLADFFCLLFFPYLCPFSRYSLSLLPFIVHTQIFLLPLNPSSTFLNLLPVFPHILSPATFLLLFSHPFISYLRLSFFPPPPPLFFFTSLTSPSQPPTSPTSGCWSTSCRLSEEVTIMRWRRCAASCRMSRRRTTVSSSYWPKTSSCLQRPESKPVCNTRSPGSLMRIWYATSHTHRYGHMQAEEEKQLQLSLFKVHVTKSLSTLQVKISLYPLYVKTSDTQ